MKFWINKGTEFSGDFSKLSEAEWKRIYSTTSKTKAAFVERTIRSLKTLLFRNMDDYGYKYIHNLTNFVTTCISTRNHSRDLIPKTVKKSHFWFFLCTKPLREYRKPKFTIGDRDSISKYDSPSRKCYKLQFTQEVFEIVAISSRTHTTYTIEDEQDEIIRGKLHQKELIKVI